LALSRAADFFFFALILGSGAPFPAEPAHASADETWSSPESLPYPQRSRSFPVQTVTPFPSSPPSSVELGSPHKRWVSPLLDCGSPPRPPFFSFCGRQFCGKLLPFDMSFGRQVPLFFFSKDRGAPSTWCKRNPEFPRFVVLSLALFLCHPVFPGAQRSALAQKGASPPCLMFPKRWDCRHGAPLFSKPLGLWGPFNPSPKNPNFFTLSVSRNTDFFFGNRECAFFF